MKPIIRIVTTGRNLEHDLARSLELTPEWRSDFARMKREWPTAEIVLPSELPSEARLRHVHCNLIEMMRTEW